MNRTIRKIREWIRSILSKLSKEPTPETRSIVILGHLGAGKTSLWNRLQNKPLDGYKSTIMQMNISAFQLNLDGKKVTIKDTHDVGGGNEAVCENYETVLKDDGTFIYYLIEYCKIEEFQKDIRAQFQKITEILRNKKLKNWGFKIILTNFDKTKTITKQDAMEPLSKLKLKSIKGLNELADYVNNYDVLNMYN
ncbi:MAG: hypothetical protein KBT04_03160, partial [Bacteroidales bacterium]|nr:hypothetical protein [Candidatus Colimorpha onthohippi]